MSKVTIDLHKAQTKTLARIECDWTLRLGLSCPMSNTSRKMSKEFPTSKQKTSPSRSTMCGISLQVWPASAMLVNMSATPVDICSGVRVEGHRSKTSSVRKHYDNRHTGAVPKDLGNCFTVLKKCRSKFDCLVNEMLLIRQLRPNLNVQSNSIRAKVFVWAVCNS